MPPGNGLTVARLDRPDPGLIKRLEAYDFEAFGSLGLRTYDLVVMAQAGAIFMAEIDGEFVGSCQLLRMLDEPAFFYVVGFYIRPESQGRHLGRALLLGVAEQAQKLGAEGLVLAVAPDNVRAMNLYRSAGFVDEAFISQFYGEGEDRHILRWRFPREACTAVYDRKPTKEMRTL
jgi:ribosomal protein S18 acetylase RimI-like enzyme